MIYSVGNSLTALKAFGDKMAVTSNNIANVESEGFKKSRALLQEGKTGDVQVEISSIDTPGHTVVEVRGDQMTEREYSNVDLGEEIPQMIPTQRGYEANLAVVKTKDEMLGSLLNIVG